MIKEYKIASADLSYSEFLNILADSVIEDWEGMIEDKTYNEIVDIVDTQFRDLVLPVAEKISDKLGISITESKKPTKNKRSTIIEKYVKVRKHK